MVKLIIWRICNIAKFHKSYRLIFIINFQFVLISHVILLNLDNYEHFRPKGSKLIRHVQNKSRMKKTESSNSFLDYMILLVLNNALRSELFYGINSKHYKIKVSNNLWSLPATDVYPKSICYYSDPLTLSVQDCWGKLGLGTRRK